MSNNPQWKTFQPPIMNSDPAILDYKSMTIPSPKVVGGPHQSSGGYRNGTSYSGDHYMGSPPSCDKSSSSYAQYPSTQTSPRNGTARFPIGTFTGMEGGVGYTGEPATNNSSYQDQSNNQGTRETGIIEKLLVSIQLDSYLSFFPQLICFFFFRLLSCSTLTDLYSAVSGRPDYFFISASSAVI